MRWPWRRARRRKVREAVDPLGIDMLADADDLRGGTRWEEADLVRCRTCGRALLLLAAGTRLAWQASITCTCIKCVEADARYQVQINEEAECQQNV